MEQAGLDPRDLAESGLGYANLLFMATVLTQLQDAAEADLTILLVEEPEAHLHPQLQSILLNYLVEEARESGRQPDSKSPWRGQIQVIVTTHSPHVATAVAPKNLVVLQRRPKRHGVAAVEGSTRSTSYETTAVAVDRLSLGKDDHIKLRSYLTATRNTFLFGQRVLSSKVWPKPCSFLSSHDSHSAGNGFNGSSALRSFRSTALTSCRTSAPS
ncbi:ATP-dependent endonuclease [Streptomyces albidoflavus]